MSNSSSSKERKEEEEEEEASDERHLPFGGAQASEEEEEMAEKSAQCTDPPRTQTPMTLLATNHSRKRTEDKRIVNTAPPPADRQDQ